MPAWFGLRFDFRNPAMAGTPLADRYQAALDMAAWADELGCVNITISEHHCSDDGYLPSPLPMVAAMAARTTNVRFTVAALIAPFYDPVRLAEDLAVIDHLSRGRVDVVIGAGYVKEEFELYGVDIAARVERVEETVAVLRAALTGEPFERNGHMVRVTPPPYRPGGPAIILGGSSRAAARRAARIGDGFMPTTFDLWEAYRQELAKLGKPDPGPSPVGPGQRTVALAEHPEQAWAQLGPFFLHENNAYGNWLADNDGTGPYQSVGDVDQLRAIGLYAIQTPDEMISELRRTPFPFAMFHPLCGGTPPELAWPSLRLFEREVMPAFA